MSPLQSSTQPFNVYTRSNHNIDPSSKVQTSKYYENGSALSTDESEYPPPKKQKLQKTSLSTPSSPTYITSTQGSLHSSDEEYEPKLITSTDQTKKTHTTSIKKQPQKTKQSALSEKQVDSLKSASISLQEFLNLYNNVPAKFRNKAFYTACKTYLYKVAKTKTSVQEKKSMFLSLPQSIKTSFSLFKSMFKQESIVLSDISSGTTDVCNLQNSINILLTFFPPSYIQRQISLFVRHKKDLSQQEKSTISICRTNLRQLDKQNTILLQSSEKPFAETINTLYEDKTNLSNDDKQTHKCKDNLPTEARKILDSLANETIDSNDIVTSRQKLVFLRVDRQIIRRAFTAFKNSVSVSQRPDKEYVLSQIKKAGDHTSKIKVSHLPFSNKLQNLYDQALAGTLPLHCIKELRDLIFKENTTVKASSSCSIAKKALIRHNKDKANDIKYAFEQAYIQSSTLPNTCKHLQAKIKEGNLDITQFSSIYDSIPQSDKTGTLSRICSKYIKSQLKNTTSFNDKIKLFKALPQSLQKSYSIISLIFPHESDIMSSIRNGKLPSSDIRRHCMQLLQIIDIAHLQHIIHQHVMIKKHLTPDEERNIAKCRSDIRALLQSTQSKIDTHTIDSNKSQDQQQEDKTDTLPSIIPTKKLKIQKTFKRTLQLKKSKHVKCFIRAIKQGNLPTKEFTNLYNHIPAQSRKGNIQKMSMEYIKGLSQQQLTFTEKMAIIKSLPKQLQTSMSTIKLFFPKIYALMSSILNGEMSSDQLMQTCTTLLSITTAKHAQTLISKYVVNKLQMSKIEQQHVSECIEMLVNIQESTHDPSGNDIEEVQDTEYNDTTSIIYQSNKSPIPTTPKTITTITQHETREEKQESMATLSEIKHVSVTAETSTSIMYPTYTSPHHSSTWYIPIPSAASEMSTYLLDESIDSQPQPIPHTVIEAPVNKQPIKSTHDPILIDTTLPRPSTSYSIETVFETSQPFSIEQISSDDLTCILQSIGNEDENSKDQIILQQYLLQLARELQEESNNVELIISKPEAKASTLQLINNTTTDFQENNTDKLLPYDEPTVHEDFSYITELAVNFNNEDLDQLADNIESTTLCQEVAPEGFFNFTNIIN